MNNVNTNDIHILSVVMVTLYRWEWFMHLHYEVNFLFHLPVVDSYSSLVLHSLCLLSTSFMITPPMQLTAIDTIKRPWPYFSVKVVIVHYFRETFISNVHRRRTVL